MISTFLDILPREIRDQVYSNVLAPTGRITIRPNDPCDSDTPALVPFPTVWPYPAIDISLIRTCKQVYRECKGVFWQRNMLHISTKYLFNPDFVNSLYTSWGQLRRLELQFGLSPPDIESVLWILQPLDALSRRGKLQEVLFTISGMGTMQKFGMVVTSQRTGMKTTKIVDIYDMLRKAGDPKTGYLSHLKRRIDMRLGIEHLSAVARKEWFEKHPPQECEDAFARMHYVLGGDLLMDGVLCYRENAQVRESFNTLAKDSKHDPVVADG